MSLFFHLSIHVIFSVLVGFAVWKIWKKPLWSFASAIASGVFVDLDHLIDYFIAFGMDFRMDYFLRSYQFLKTDKIYVILHGWEYVIILFAALLFLKSQKAKTAVAALALGLFFHLGVDTLLNQVPARSYFLLYRVKHKFDIEKLLSWERYEEHTERGKSVGIDK